MKYKCFNISFKTATQRAKCRLSTCQLHDDVFSPIIHYRSEEIFHCFVISYRFFADIFEELKFSWRRIVV